MKNFSSLVAYSINFNVIIILQINKKKLKATIYIYSIFSSQCKYLIDIIFTSGKIKEKNIRAYIIYISLGRRYFYIWTTEVTFNLFYS